MIRRGMISVYLITECCQLYQYTTLYSRIPAFPVLHPLAHSNRIPCYQSHSMPCSEVRVRMVQIEMLPEHFIPLDLNA